MQDSIAKKNALGDHGEAVDQIHFARLVRDDTEGALAEAPHPVLLKPGGHAWFRVIVSDGTGLEDVSLKEGKDIDGSASRECEAFSVETEVR